MADSVDTLQIPTLEGIKHGWSRPRRAYNGMDPKFYVYVLADPRDGEIFYVGKGCGQRMHVHERDARRGRIYNFAKHIRIEGIVVAGLSVDARKVEIGLTEPEALRVERKLIAQIGLANLTNATPGESDVYEQLVYHAKVGIRKWEKVLEDANRGVRFVPGWIEAAEGWLVSLRRIVSEYGEANQSTA